MSETSAIWSHRKVILQPWREWRFLRFTFSVPVFLPYSSDHYITCYYCLHSSTCLMGKYLICVNQDTVHELLSLFQSETTCAFCVHLNGPGECGKVYPYCVICSCLYHNPGVTCKPDSSQRSQSHNKPETHISTTGLRPGQASNK